MRAELANHQDFKEEKTRIEHLLNGHRQRDLLAYTATTWLAAYERMSLMD